MCTQVKKEGCLVGRGARNRTVLLLAITSSQAAGLSGVWDWRSQESSSRHSWMWPLPIPPIPATVQRVPLAHKGPFPGPGSLGRGCGRPSRMACPWAELCWSWSLLLELGRGWGRCSGSQPTPLGLEAQRLFSHSPCFLLFSGWTKNRREETVWKN